MSVVDVPATLRAFAARGPAWAEWLAQLPRLVQDLLDEWDLTVDGASRHGETALVVPVRVAGGAAMLKVGWPHPEAEHEHLALRLWAGRGAVRLLRADPHRSALLLERLHSRDLTSVPIVEACEIVANRYADLHLAATPALRPVSAMCADWAERLTALRSRSDLPPPLPPRYVERAAVLARDFASDPATDGVIVHGDLHYFNVLAADREPWLVIDPKPMSGEPAFDVAPMLWNRWDEVLASGSVRGAIRERFETIVDVAGLDEERAKAWVVLRMVVNAMWEVEDPSPDETDSWLTDAITIAKAMDD